jgi:hypothetical protein
MHSPRQVPWNLKLAFDEGLVDDHLGRDRAQLRLAPGLYLMPHGLEVPLHPVHTDRDGVYKRKALRVFGQDRLKVAMNNMAKLPFELSVPISRARLKPRRGVGIVAY